MTASESRPRQSKQLDAGIFQPEISSFRLNLAAEGKAAKTIRTYAEAVQWFAGEYLTKGDRLRGLGAGDQAGCAAVDHVAAGVLQQCVRQQQCRALQQFFKWLADEEEFADPMAGMKPPRVPEKAVPVFADAGSRAVAWRRVSRSSREPPGTDHEP